MALPARMKFATKAALPENFRATARNRKKTAKKTTKKTTRKPAKKATRKASSNASYTLDNVYASRSALPTTRGEMTRAVKQITDAASKKLGAMKKELTAEEKKRKEAEKKLRACKRKSPRIGQAKTSTRMSQTMSRAAGSTKTYVIDGKRVSITKNSNGTWSWKYGSKSGGAKSFIGAYQEAAAAIGAKPTKKRATKKRTTKKRTTKKRTAKKTTRKKAAKKTAKKRVTKKRVAKKTTTRRAPAKKTARKKAVKKSTTRRAPAKKTTRKKTTRKAPSTKAVSTTKLDFTAGSKVVGKGRKARVEPRRKKVWICAGEKVTGCGGGGKRGSKLVGMLGGTKRKPTVYPSRRGIMKLKL